MGVYIGTNKYTGGPADPSSSMIPKSIGTAAGDMIYFSSSATPVRLPIGSNGQVLTLSNGLPSWQTPSGGGGGGSSTLGGLTDTTISNLSAGQVLQYLNGSWRNSDDPSLFYNPTDAGIDQLESDPPYAFMYGITDMDPNRRNFASINITPQQYTQNWINNGLNSNDTSIGIVFDDMCVGSDNYVLIYNGVTYNNQGVTFTLDPERICVYGEQYERVYQVDSNNSSPFTLPPYSYTLIGVTLTSIPLIDAEYKTLVITYGGRFVYV